MYCWEEALSMGSFVVCQALSIGSLNEISQAYSGEEESRDEASYTYSSHNDDDTHLFLPPLRFDSLNDV